MFRFAKKLDKHLWELGNILKQDFNNLAFNEKSPKKFKLQKIF